MKDEQAVGKIVIEKTDKVTGKPIDGVDMNEVIFVIFSHMSQKATHWYALPSLLALCAFPFVFVVAPYTLHTWPIDILHILIKV